MDVSKLKPCPFCGDRLADAMELVSGVRIVCWTCGASSSLEDNLDDAVAQWNMRAIKDEDLIDIGVYAENIIGRLKKIRGKK